MTPRSLPILLVACLVLSAGATAQDQPSFLLSPPPGDGPVVVQVGFFLSDVNRIDIEQQQFEVEGVLTLTWQDDRLAFDPDLVGVDEKVFQGNYQFSEVATGWWPQLVLANESGGYERQGIVLRNRFDGRITYVEEMNAVVEMPVELRRFPFDRERFELIFEVLGFDKDEVVLVVDSSTTGTPAKGISLSEWKLEGLHASSGDHDPVYIDGRQEMQSAVVVSLDLARYPGFMLRVVVFPMVLLVMLSWSVFWMDRESLGERMDISFIGILTVVAYQIMVSSTIPRIPYFTLMSAFIYISFVTMCASVVINLVVGRMDRTGRRELGDRVDRRCRWVFPTTYATLLLFAAAYFFVRY
jgi:hypothetical protein